MNVFILIKNDYEASEIIGVYFDAKKADEVCRYQESINSDRYGISFEVVEKEVI